LPRAPFQVLIYPYRKIGEYESEYALLKRSVEGFWQAVAGGGQVGETPLEAAKRETSEETGIPPDSGFLRLDTVIPVRVTEFKDSYLWGQGVYVIPIYCYGVNAADHLLVLSHEHTEYQWLNYKDAYRMTKFDGDKTALWELNKRLRGLGPRE
jgi:dATP pyrophosphohydrolase